MADERSSHWVSTLPEIAYDFLARILPGVLTLVMCWAAYISYRAWFWSNPLPAALKQGQPFGWASFTELLFLSWALGLLLTPLGRTSWVYIRRKETILTFVKSNLALFRAAEQRNVFLLPNDITFQNSFTVDQEEEIKKHSDHIYQQLHEHLKEESAAWGAVLTKGRAEVTCYANIAGSMRLFSGLVTPALLLSLMASKLWPHSTPANALLLAELPLVVIAGSLWPWFHKRRRSLGSVCCEIVVILVLPVTLGLKCLIAALLPQLKRSWQFGALDYQLLGFFFSVFIPAGLLWWLSRQGMKSKFKHVWVRHIALLAVDQRLAKDLQIKVANIQLLAKSMRGEIDPNESRENLRLMLDVLSDRAKN